MATLAASGGNDGTASLKVVVNARGHTVNRVQLFLGTMQIAESTGATLAYVGPMFDGTNTLWVRVTYDTNYTMDSQPTTLVVKGPPVKDGWAFAVVGEPKTVRGVWQTAPDAFSFIGEGEYVITRRVTGDFTLTCRIDSYSGSKGEPVNGWFRGDNDMPLLHAVTCPDALLPLLGRGKPALAVSVRASHDYVSHDGGKSLRSTCEWPELGYLNIAFDKGSWAEPSYATTHGYCQSLQERKMFLSPGIKDMEAFRPFTAVASSGHGDTRCGRALLQALDPVRPGRLSRSDHFGFRWEWVTFEGDVPPGGFIAGGYWQPTGCIGPMTAAGP